MDDGTEDDYDSHIMVWQVADQGVPPALSLSSLSSMTSASSLLLSPTEATRNPSTHSSIELGPTPGSGMALDSQSEDAHFFGSDTDSETPAPSLHLPETQPLPQPYYEPPVEALAWSDDVESMLNNPPPSTFHSFNLSREPSLSSWVLPPESEPHQSISEQPSIVATPMGGLERIPESESSLDPLAASVPVIFPSSTPSPASPPPDSLSPPSPKPGLPEPVEDFAGHPSRLC